MRSALSAFHAYRQSAVALTFSLPSEFRVSLWQVPEVTSVQLLARSAFGQTLVHFRMYSGDVLVMLPGGVDGVVWEQPVAREILSSLLAAVELMFAVATCAHIA